MTREEIEACWRDPRNRKWGLFYCCKADPRVIVPKRPKWMGWTVNVAHPRAIPITLLLIALLAAPVGIVISMGASIGIVVATVAAATAVVCLLCAYLSSRTR
ncbi:MAG: DUF5808 domain-containing protein [Verrucomicrobia bacterium]|nr:DUF5808 domain-containing protein [Verrucomicrobiota bacterium]